MGSFTRQQWTILTVLYLSFMCVFIPVGILQPFYPVLAMSKGATPAQFGLVFGVFRLTMCLGSPLLGKLIHYMGTRFMFSAGVFLVGGCSILMGLINYIVDTTVFLNESYAIQTVSGFGTVMAAISATTLVNKEFPDDMGAVFAGIEIAVGAGQVLGPLMGGALMQYNGFTLPFVLFGSILMFVAVLDALLLPDTSEKTSTASEAFRQVSILSILKLPIIIVFIISLVPVCFAFGFFMVTYEIHLEQLNLTPFQVSAMFAINSFMFCLSSWVAGWVSDKYLSPLTVALVGAVLTLISFILMGPAPFLPIPYDIPLAIIANILFGIGYGTQVVATFSGMGRGAIASNLPDNISTHGLICGLWNCLFSLGCFVGFTLGGGLLQAMGYQWATVIVIGMELLVVSIICLFCLSGRCVLPEPTCDETCDETRDETTSLLQSYLSYGQRSSFARNTEHNLSTSISLGHGLTYSSIHQFSTKDDTILRK